MRLNSRTLWICWEEKITVFCCGCHLNKASLGALPAILLRWRDHSLALRNTWPSTEKGNLLIFEILDPSEPEEHLPLDFSSTWAYVYIFIYIVYSISIIYLSLFELLVTCNQISHLLLYSFSYSTNIDRVLLHTRHYGAGNTVGKAWWGRLREMWGKIGGVDGKLINEFGFFFFFAKEITWNIYIVSC